MTTVTAPRSRGRSRRLPISIALPALDGPALAAALVFVLMFALGLLQYTAVDYFWHIETGRYIVESGAVPTRDPFSFTVEGKDWVAHEWLSDVLLYGIQETLGYGANALLFGGLAATALAIAFFTALSTGVSRWFAAGLLLWASALILPFWTVRPLIFSWLLFAVFLKVLVDYSRGMHRGRVWFLPLLMLLWVNLHAGFVIGVALVALFLAAQLVERYVLSEERDLRIPSMLFVTCVLMTLINPHTYRLWLYPLIYIMPGNAIVETIVEWQSPDFHSPAHLLLAPALVALAGIGLFDRRRDLFLPFVLLLCAYLALQAVRHQPLFALAFLVGTAIIAAGRWDWARQKLSRDETPGGRSLINWLAVCSIALVLAFWLVRSPDAQLGREARVDTGVGYPVEGAAFIAQHYPDARVFNTLHWGGYLIHVWRPQKVFIDGRVDLYGNSFIRDYDTIEELGAGWQEILDRYAIDVVLVQKERAIVQGLDLSPGWRRVFTGEVEVVFARDR